MGEARAKITAKMLRSIEAKEYHVKQPCHICGLHNSVTVLHHIVPIEKAVEFINKGWINLSTPRKTVWLCPTCHAYAHFAYRYLKKDKGDVKRLLEIIGKEADTITAQGALRMVIESNEEEIAIFKKLGEKTEGGCYVQKQQAVSG
jgi:hypothetical protein